MLPEIIISIVILAFIFEFFDASLGMGFGTTITAVLIILGYSPLYVIPSVLFTNAIMGIVAGFVHHRFENVNFHWNSKDLKISIVLTAFGILGMIIAVLIALELPEAFLRLYIGFLVLGIGVYILIHHKKDHSFSWKKISGLGLIAAFNKGMTGGGYGSVLVGGQILSGINSRSAIAIAALTEGLVSIIGVIAYITLNGTTMHWEIIRSLLLGGLISIPIAAYVVKRFHPKHLKAIVGIVSILLGIGILSWFII